MVSLLRLTWAEVNFVQPPTWVPGHSYNKTPRSAQAIPDWSIAPANYGVTIRGIRQIMIWPWLDHSWPLCMGERKEKQIVLSMLLTLHRVIEFHFAPLGHPVFLPCLMEADIFIYLFYAWSIILYSLRCLFKGSIGLHVHMQREQVWNILHYKMKVSNLSSGFVHLMLQLAFVGCEGRENYNLLF